MPKFLKAFSPSQMRGACATGLGLSSVGLVKWSIGYNRSVGLEAAWQPGVTAVVILMKPINPYQQSSLSGSTCLPLLCLPPPPPPSAGVSLRLSPQSGAASVSAAAAAAFG